MSFTKEETLKLHRDMWGKIREEYGNEAEKWERWNAKRKYMRSKGHSCMNFCYLCEYADEMDREKWVEDACTLCPIDWSALADEDDPERGNCIALYKNGLDSIYKCAPIDEILALPERK